MKVMFPYMFLGFACFCYYVLLYFPSCFHPTGRQHRICEVTAVYRSDSKACNALLLKVNQIGSITEVALSGLFDAPSDLQWGPLRSAADSR